MQFRASGVGLPLNTLMSTLVRVLERSKAGFILSSKPEHLTIRSAACADDKFHNRAQSRGARRPIALSGCSARAFPRRTPSPETRRALGPLGQRRQVRVARHVSHACSARGWTVRSNKDKSRIKLAVQTRELRRRYCFHVSTIRPTAQFLLRTPSLCLYPKPAFQRHRQDSHPVLIPVLGAVPCPCPWPKLGARWPAPPPRARATCPFLRQMPRAQLLSQRDRRRVRTAEAHLLQRRQQQARPLVTAAERRRQRRAAAAERNCHPTPPPHRLRSFSRRRQPATPPGHPTALPRTWLS
jgi:hypothetical protein